MNIVKTLALALAVSAGLAAIVPGAAMAYDNHHRGHRVCHFDHHHHRYCHWVR